MHLKCVHCLMRRPCRKQRLLFIFIFYHLQVVIFRRIVHHQFVLQPVASTQCLSHLISSDSVRRSCVLDTPKNNNIILFGERSVTLERAHLISTGAIRTIASVLCSSNRFTIFSLSIFSLFQWTVMKRFNVKWGGVDRYVFEEWMCVRESINDVYLRSLDSSTPAHFEYLCSQRQFDSDDKLKLLPTLFIYTQGKKYYISFFVDRSIAFSYAPQHIPKMCEYDGFI